MPNNTRPYSVATVALVILAIAYGTLSNSGETLGTQTKYKKLALLVGIDDYKYMSDLRGTVNDVKNMKTLLVESFGFPDDEEHIRVLTNKRATREAIISSIEEHLIAKARSDSIIVFHYSGHGSQMRDEKGGDETDGWDETIVAHDSGRRSFPNRDITDDELNALLGKLTDKTPNVTFIFDSCHSGTAVRGAGLARTVEPDMRPPPKRKRTFATSARGVSQGKSDLRPENSRYALISGSAAHELSYELRVGGQSHGAMTWYLTDQIRRAGANATYRDIMDVVKSRVSATYSRQHPQLEGPGEDQFVFSDKSLVPAPSVQASPVGGNRVTLAAGQVHGVTKGSIYEVYPPGTKSFGADAKSIARIEVISVDVTTSTAKVSRGKVTQAASRAVEREHYWPDVVLGVYLKGLNRSKTLQKIRTKLLEYKHIGQVKTETAYSLLLREENGFIVTEAGDPAEISPRVAVTGRNAVSRVAEQVTHWARWFNILEIRNQQPELRVGFNLKLSEEALARARTIAEPEVGLTLLQGERFTIEVTNKGKENLYIALLDLSSDGSVGVVYPIQGEQEFVAPGKAWRKPLQTFLPKGRDSVRDVLKVFATTTFADFSFLQQSAVRGGPALPTTRGRRRNQLEQLLANAALGTTRGVKQVEVENWTTAERVLEVRRKE